MQRLIAGLLVLALVGAGATVWLVNSYINQRVEDNAKKVVPVQSATKVVLVAKQNIPIGKKIAAGDMEWLHWPDTGVRDNFVSANQPNAKLAGNMVGTIARRGIIKGTPLTEEAIFRSTTPGFLAGALEPDMRAVSISITAETGASGFIMPGDRVDVILMQDVSRNITGKAAESQEAFRPYLRYTAETVIQNLRVLAVDQKIDDFEKKAQVSKTVTVEVTQKQAEALAVVRAMGKIGLALRSLLDAKPDRSFVAQGTGRNLLGGDLSKAASKVPQTEPLPKIHNAGVTNEEPTVTTDLEISPVLAATVSTASGLSSKPSKAPPQKVQSETRVRSSIRIYRGGQPSTVNF